MDIENLHAGIQVTLVAFRQKYWVISSQNNVKRVIHQCNRCSRANPKLLQQPMGNLPKDRTVLIRPFLKSGVDYAGPMFIKERGRGKQKVKAYIALSVCLSTKAVHVELVGDLTAESFLNAL